MKFVRIILAALSAAILHCQVHAFDPVVFVEAAIARGEKEICVPKGRYFVDLPTNRTSYLSIKGASDVTVDFCDSELIGKTLLYKLYCICLTVGCGIW